MNHSTTIDAAITEATGNVFFTERQWGMEGGCINQTWAIEGNGRRFFVKMNAACAPDMFAAEAEGLNAILASGAIRAPRPICSGSADGVGYLVLEYLCFGQARSESMAQLGIQLAALHRHTNACFGWHRDNTIGATPQLNSTTYDWITFWRERRLRYQLQHAAQRGCSTSLRQKGERLLNTLDKLFKDHRPNASLLHGDLWSGNCATLDDGQPVIFDPAVYYGDRETDLAMTELFGGFSPSFYDAYREHYPLDDGYSLRKISYNLYHVLNHYNLFGGGYASQAERMIDRLLSETHR